MENQPKPLVWQMIKEAVEVHGNRTTNLAVRDWILEHYPGVNVNTILNQIIICTVNHQSRVHYKENSTPRRCCDIYDFLFRPATGKLEMYDPRIHGEWEIAQDEKGVLFVREVKKAASDRKEPLSVGGGYLEARQLRAYLAKHLYLIEEGLELYVDVFGNDGVGYPSDFGPVDILALDKNGTFVVVKVEGDNFHDASSGQILKYRNWVRRHLAQGKPVRSYLVGSEIPDHVRYSLADCEDVFLKEYDLSLSLRDIPKINDISSVPPERNNLHDVTRSA
ncbi:MAG TPA: hypothetical protein PLE24_05175 [Chitinispirillaceae bacterium]|jgi:hypothetical protein|nr:hypothetical protein [Chitinispirillaceae bacterium]